MDKFKATLNDRSHTLFIAILLFIMEQLAFMPIDQISRHAQAVNSKIILAIIMLAIVVYWGWQLIYQNRAVNTNHDFYNSLGAIIFNIVLILILAQIWAKFAIPMWHLPLGGTSQNQQSILALNKNPISHAFQVLMAALIAPMIEEILFRYAIIGPKDQLLTTKANYKIMIPWTKFQNHHPKRARLIKLFISIVLFALTHMLAQLLSIHTSQQAKAAIYETVQYLIVSAVFSINYYRRSNIFENIAMHIIYNSFVLSLI